SNEGQEITLIVDEVKKLVDIVFEKSASLSLTLPQSAEDEGVMEEVISLLSKSKGACSVFINVELENGIEAKVLAEPLRIEGSSILETKLVERGCKVVWN
ncbi:MAG: hypothetical protein HKN25_01380, partial [Pyrinomonadaceae bacterium]|nr:hypothetical protein [Pyrinomonadaceae bacterium]